MVRKTSEPASPEVPNKPVGAGVPKTGGAYDSAWVGKGDGGAASKS